MNGLIVLLIILLGALIINQIISNINNLSNTEGFTEISKDIWKKACKEQNTKKLKKDQESKNEIYKKLEGKYNDLMEEAAKKNKKAMLLQKSIKDAEVDTENDIRVAKHKMKQDEKRTAAAANAFGKVKYKKDIGTISAKKKREY